MKQDTKNKIKKWAHIVWNAPGVENAVLQIIVKTLSRVGLPTAIAAVVVSVAEAVAGQI